MNERTIFIQSKSGNYNVTTRRDEALHEILAIFRKVGGYYASSDGRNLEMFVPFEEIEYIAARRTD